MIKCNLNWFKKQREKILNEILPSSTASVLNRWDVGFQAYRSWFDAVFRSKKLVDYALKKIDDTIKSQSNPFVVWAEAHNIIVSSMKNVVTLLSSRDDISPSFLKTINKAIEWFENIYDTVYLKVVQDRINWKGQKKISVHEEASREAAKIIATTFEIIFKPKDGLWEKWPALSFLRHFAEDYSWKLEEFRKFWSVDLMEELFWIDWDKISKSEAFWFDYLLWPWSINSDWTYSNYWVKGHQEYLTALLYNISNSKPLQFLWKATLLLRNLWRRWLFFVDPAWALNMYMSNGMQYVSVMKKQTEWFPDWSFEKASELLYMWDGDMPMSEKNRMKEAYIWIRSWLARKWIISKYGTKDARESIIFWVEQWFYALGNEYDIMIAVKNEAIDQWYTPQQFNKEVEENNPRVRMVILQWYENYRRSIWAWEYWKLMTQVAWTSWQAILWFFYEWQTFLLNFFMAKTISDYNNWVNAYNKTRQSWKEHTMFGWSDKTEIYGDYLNKTAPFWSILARLWNAYLYASRQIRIWDDDDDDDDDETRSNKMFKLRDWMISMNPAAVWMKVTWQPFNEAVSWTRELMDGNEAAAYNKYWTALEAYFRKPKMFLKALMAITNMSSDTDVRSVSAALANFAWWTIYHVLWEDYSYSEYQKVWLKVDDTFATVLFSRFDDEEMSYINKVIKNIKMWAELERDQMWFITKQLPLVWEMIQVYKWAKWFFDPDVNLRSKSQLNADTELIIKHPSFNSISVWIIPKDVTPIEWSIYRDRYFKAWAGTSKNQKIIEAELIKEVWKEKAEKIQAEIQKRLMDEPTWEWKNRNKYAEMNIYLNNNVKNTSLIRDVYAAQLENNYKNQNGIKSSMSPWETIKMKSDLWNKYGWLLHTELKDRIKYEKFIDEYFLRRIPSLQKYIKNADEFNDISLDSNGRSKAQMPLAKLESLDEKWYMTKVMTTIDVLNWKIDWFWALAIQEKLSWLYSKSTDSDESKIKMLESKLNIASYLQNLAVSRWYWNYEQWAIAAPIVASAISILPEYLKSDKVSAANKDIATKALYNISKDVVKNLSNAFDNDAIWLYSKWEYKKYTNSYNAVKSYYQKQPYYDKYYVVNPQWGYRNYTKPERDTIKNYAKSYWEQYFVRLNWYDKTSFLTPDGISGWKTTVLKPKSAKPRELSRRAVYARSNEAGRVATPGDPKPIVWTLNDGWSDSKQRKKSNWKSRKAKS